MKIIVFGLSITSSWGNGHATTYRALLDALNRRKHRIVFFEKNEEWYASNRDLPDPRFCELRLFEDWNSILPAARRELADCDVVVAGSYFPEALRAIPAVLDSKAPTKIFYDIDTPITLKGLRNGGAGYLQPEHVPGFDLYLSFTGGPILRQLESEFGARCARPLYCSFETRRYYPGKKTRRYECDLSYMGTYAPDRQIKLEELFTQAALASPRMKFLLAGSQYPAKLEWPPNIRHIKHLSPRWHPHFYSSSRFTLNLTRKEMVAWGYSPSVRLFEAAACAAPIISDSWPGLDRFFTIGEEILIADTAGGVTSYLKDMDEAQRRKIGERSRERILAEHSSNHRAIEFENYVAACARTPKKELPAHMLSIGNSLSAKIEIAHPVS